MYVYILTENSHDLISFFTMLNMGLTNSTSPEKTPLIFYQKEKERKVTYYIKNYFCIKLYFLSYKFIYLVVIFKFFYYCFIERKKIISFMTYMKKK